MNKSDSRPVAAVIRHIAFEGPDSFANVLTAQGFALRDLDASTGCIEVDFAADADLLVVLGGPIGVNDTEEFPVLRQELAALERRLAGHRATLGICLGAQLIAHALGASVTPGSAEIGWSPLTLTRPGGESPLRHLDADTPVLHWHNDRFELPDGATCLASTPATPNQAFAWQNTLALQFHPEVTAAGLEPWYIGHHRSITAAPGLTVSALRNDSRQYASRLATHSRLLLQDWLATCGLTTGNNNR